MLLKDLQELCKYALDDSQQFRDLRSELNILAKNSGSTTAIRIITEATYQHLVDKATRFEYVLLTCTLDRISNTKFSDDDKRNLQAIIQYIQNSSKPDVMRYFANY